MWPHGKVEAIGWHDFRNLPALRLSRQQKLILEQAKAPQTREEYIALAAQTALSPAEVSRYYKRLEKKKVSYVTIDLFTMHSMHLFNVYPQANKTCRTTGSFLVGGSTSTAFREIKEAGKEKGWERKTQYAKAKAYYYTNLFCVLESSVFPIRNKWTPLEEHHLLNVYIVEMNQNEGTFPHTTCNKINTPQHGTNWKQWL